jgi:phosphatidylglycerol:prolipoprotein diacylglycerol transferase
MYSTLGTIPPLPIVLLLPLLFVLVGVALFVAARDVMRLRAAPLRAPSGTGSGTGSSIGTEEENAAPDAFVAVATPLLIAAMLGLLLWVWSRNPIKLHSYGLMLMLGAMVGTWSACGEARRRGVDPNIILDMAMPLLVSGVVMCRILYIALEPGAFTSPGRMLRVWDGGLSFHGALIAAPIVVAWYARRNGLSFGQLADIIAPSVFLGYAIGRVGCLLNGCCYGAVCDLPWAMQFPDERHRGALTPFSHPTQLYSSLLALALFFVMQRARLSPRFNRFPGQITLLFCALYAIERAIVEVFRNGATATTVLGTSWLTQAQLASAIGLFVVAALWVFRMANLRPPTMETPPASASKIPKLNT